MSGIEQATNIVGRDSLTHNIQDVRPITPDFQYLETLESLCGECVTPQQKIEKTVDDKALLQQWLSTPFVKKQFVIKIDHEGRQTYHLIPWYERNLEIKSALNGNNGEATNSDDHDNSDRKRTKKESITNRFRKGGNKEHMVTFTQLSRNLIDARKSYRRALLDDDVDSKIYQSNVTDIMSMISEKYPERFKDISETPMTRDIDIPEQSFPILKTITLYSAGTDSGSDKFYRNVSLVSFIIGLLTYVLFLLEHEDSHLYLYTSSVFLIGGIIIHICRALCSPSYTTIHPPGFVSSFSKTTSDDDAFRKIKVQQGTFPHLKGYAYKFEVSIPEYFFEYRNGSAQHVVSGCCTDSRLVEICYTTLIRDQYLLEKYNESRNVHSYDFYCRYCAVYFAQQHMFHLYETSLMTGRLGKVSLPIYDGSTLNFRYSGRIDGSVRLGIFRQKFENSSKVEDWTDNQRFTVVKFSLAGRSYKCRMTPTEWRKNYSFTEVDHVNQKHLQRYRTRILTFSNGGLMYARTTTNLYSGLNRMFSVRENAELERELVYNQFNNVKLGSRRYGKILSDISRVIQLQFVQDCEIDDLLGQLQLIQEKHPKKKLREQAHDYIIQMSLIKNAAYATKVTAKVKIEVAKFMKNARIYVDMTTPQSLLGGWLIDPLKNAMKMVDLGWCLFVFVKTTDEQTVRESFKILRDNKHRPVCVYHSDDAVLQLPCSDGTYIANLDISSCDRSNLKPIFDLLLEFIPNGPWKFLYERMVQGCSLPLIIPNPSLSNEYIKVVPNGPFEYSGCNLTTVLNNTALLAISASIFSKFDKRMAKHQMSSFVAQRAKSVGYIITLQECVCFEQIQFLKFSPSDEHECHPVRNLGCVLRALGHIDGDLPGRGDIDLRAKNHLAQVVNGITSGYVDSISGLVRQRFSLHTLPGISNKYQYQVCDYSHIVSDTHLLKRYNIDDKDLYILRSYILNLSIGDFLVSSILAKIFAVDYG